MTTTNEATTTTVAGITPALIYLSADGELKPANTVDADLPPRVSDLPAFYYWKDAIVVGAYVHPAADYSLDITRSRLDGYAETFRKMKANGVGVPIVMDHATTAAATLGWIVDVRREDDRLMELHQFLGEDARDIGLRNKVSLGIDPDFVDGKGIRYGEAIVHSAVTPVPVVPGQGEFEAAEFVTLSLATPKDEDLTPSPGTADRRSPGEGGGEGDLENDERGAMNDEEVYRSSFPAHRSSFLPNHPHPNPLPETCGQQYRARGPEGEMQFALAAMIDAASAKRDLAVAGGAIAPAVADELFALLVKSSAGVVNTLCLSRTSPSSATPPLALAVFDALSRNQPVPLGEVTRLQVLSRIVPGSGDEELAQLQQRMIALASGRST